MDRGRAYEVRAKVPASASKDDVKVMYQHLLEERFKLTFHRANEGFPGL